MSSFYSPDGSFKYPDADIAMIKSGEWPCQFALPVKRVNRSPAGSGELNYGCIPVGCRTTVLLCPIFEFDPNALRMEYDSVEELVKTWMVD